MKQDVLLVNTSRGDVVNEHDATVSSRSQKYFGFYAGIYRRKAIC